MVYRILLTIFLRGLVVGSGLLLCFWIGGDRLPWQLLLGVVAAGLLLNVIQLLPAMRAYSFLQQALKEDGTDLKKVEASLGLKPPPLLDPMTLLMLPICCFLGLIFRWIQ